MRPNLTEVICLYPVQDNVRTEAMRKSLIEQAIKKKHKRRKREKDGNSASDNATPE